MSESGGVLRVFEDLGRLSCTLEVRNPAVGRGITRMLEAARLGGLCVYVCVFASVPSSLLCKVSFPHASGYHQFYECGARTKVNSGSRKTDTLRSLPYAGSLLRAGV